MPDYRMGGSLSYTPEGLLAEFANIETEREFGQSRLAVELENVRRTLLGILVAMVLVAVLDATLLRGTPNLVMVLSLRGLVGLSSLAGLWFLLGQPSRIQLEAGYLVVWTCLTSVLTRVALEQGPGLNQPWQVFYFSAAGLVAFLPCRLRVGLTAGCILLMGALTVGVCLREHPHYAAHVVVGTGGALTVGYAIVHGIERLLRQDYMRGEQLRADRSVLEQTRNALRVQLMLAQQAQALGLLAAGTTHDFNNMLMAIRANALSVRDSIAPTSPLDLAGARDASEDILEAVDSASDLSRRLLTFGKPNNAVTAFVNLDQATQRALHTMQRLVPKRITLTTELNAGNRMVSMQGTYLEQIVSNLVVNAIQAVPAEGTIAVRTSYDLATERVVLLVRDSGVGMSSEQLCQVFQPFFTTKPTGNGLGLPTVKLIVEESRGEVLVESIEGQGTSVSILLPVVATSDIELYERPAVSGFISMNKQHTA
jgi:signal transduction histidine kinase